MEKKLLAIAVVSAAVALPTQAANVYKDGGTTFDVSGRIEGRFNISDANETATENTFKDISRARMALVANQEISSGLSGFAKYEMQVDGDAVYTNRFYYAGVGTSVGAFSYGRNNTAAILVTDYTDTLLTFGGAASEAVAPASEQQNGTFLYDANFDAFTLRINLNPAMNDSGPEEEMGYGIAGEFSLSDNLAIAAAYGGAKDDSEYLLGAKFNQDVFGVAGVFFGGSDIDDDFMGFELVGDARFGDFKGILSYNYRDYDTDGTDVDEFVIEGDYYVSSNLRAYLAYKLNNVDNGEDAIQGGIRYDY